jgi:hypothetical protein
MQNDVTCIKKRMKTVRKTIEIDTDLADAIEIMSTENKWSFSKMGYVLLQQAVKERLRKRNGKKLHIQDHS